MALNKNVLNSFLKKGDKIIVGVSGGADSMCLLSLIKDYAHDVDVDFIAVHVNHNIRDKEAKRDEDFVCGFCKKHNIKFKSVHVKVLDKA